MLILTLNILISINSDWKISHYLLKTYAIGRSNSSNMFAENLPFFCVLRGFSEKRGGCIGQRVFILVQRWWSIAPVWEVRGCHSWVYLLFSSSGAREALRGKLMTDGCWGQRSFSDKLRQVATVAGLIERSKMPFQLLCARSCCTAT